MARKSLISPRWRPVTVALTVVLTLAVLMSVAPVREAAADFLGLFRVRKFAVIPIDPAQAQRLEGLAQQAESVLGQPTILRAEGPRQDVSDAAEASERAGFRVRLPATLPDETTYATFNGRTSLQVQSGPAIHYEVQRSVLEALMQATGVSTAGLPQTKTIGVTVDVGQGVAAEYRLDRGRISLFQTPSPSVDLPEGLDVVALSQTAFQFIGIPADEARRLATTIDWSSTLVLPLPTDMAQAQEVSIDGVTGLLVRSTDNSRNTNQETLLLWERDGIVYAMNGYGVESATLLSVAGSLQ